MKVPARLTTEELEGRMDRLATVAPSISDETTRQIVREMLRSGAQPRDFRRIGELFYRLARNENFRRATEPKPGTFQVFKKSAKK